MEDTIRVNMFQSGLDAVGGIIDNISMPLSGFRKSFRSIRDIDRDTYERELNFYFKRGYVQHPETFFSLPEDLPSYRMLQEKPFLDGRQQVISFESRYDVRNPLISERFQSHEANRTAYLVRWFHGDPGRKTIVCLHDYLGGSPGQARRIFKIRALYRRGLDVALFAAPFHWKRTPRLRHGEGAFLQPNDVGITAECFGQAIHDLTHCLNIIEKEGGGKIGIIGAGLGGYKAGLMASLTNRISFAALIAPLVKTSPSFGPLAADYMFPIDQVFRVKVERVWTMHTPLHFAPKVPKDRVLVIAARGDRFCPFEHAVTLCERWQLPRRSFLTGGHRMLFGRSRWLRTLQNFLGDMGFM